jgi:hypothetical protein
VQVVEHERERPANGGESQRSHRAIEGGKSRLPGATPELARQADERVVVHPELAEDLNPRPIRGRAAGLPAASPGNAQAAPHGFAGDVLGEPRFPDTRLAAEQQERSAARAHLLEPEAGTFEHGGTTMETLHPATVLRGDVSGNGWHRRGPRVETPSGPAG